MLSQMPVKVSRYLCQPEFAGWLKSHRRSRINKKWHKRYGPRLRCKGRAYQIGDTFVVCPCVERKMREAA